MAQKKHTKTSIINDIYEHSDLKLKDISKSVDMFLDSISKILALGETVEIRGFGVFEVKKHLGRKGLNLKTGEIKQNSDYNKVSFRAGASLKQIVSEVQNDKML